MIYMTKRIDNQKNSKSVDDLNLVHGITNYLKLMYWRHMTPRSSVFSNNKD